MRVTDHLSQASPSRSAFIVQRLLDAHDPRDVVEPCLPNDGDPDNPPVDYHRHPKREHRHKPRQGFVYAPTPDGAHRQKVYPPDETLTPRPVDVEIPAPTQLALGLGEDVDSPENTLRTMPVFDFPRASSGYHVIHVNPVSGHRQHIGNLLDYDEIAVDGTHRELYRVRRAKGRGNVEDLGKFEQHYTSKYDAALAILRALAKPKLGEAYDFPDQGEQEKPEHYTDPDAEALDSLGDTGSDVARLLPTKTYRLGGNSMIYAPGVIRLAQSRWKERGAKAKQNAKDILNAWKGISPEHVERILNGDCTIAPEGDHAVVTLKL